MDTFASGMIDDDCLKTETQYEDDQDMSVKQDATAENPDKMIDDLQNPMSQAPPSVRSEYDAPESPAHYSPAPSPMAPSMDSPPMSPMLPPSTPGSVARPPRPDTANSMMSEGGTPTPIAFGTIPRSETPMSQRKFSIFNNAMLKFLEFFLFMTFSRLTDATTYARCATDTNLTLSGATLTPSDSPYTNPTAYEHKPNVEQHAPAAKVGTTKRSTTTHELARAKGAHVPSVH